VISTRVQFLATLNRESAKAGDPIELRLRVKNVSSKAVYMYDVYWMLDYTVVVTDASGEELPRTALGEQWRQEQREGFRGGSLHMVPPLQPDAEGEEFIIDIAKYYQLTKPGRYLVRAVRNNLDTDSGERPTVAAVTAVSNTLAFTITP